VPLIVHWPERIDEAGAIRTQFHHVTDVLPTVLENLGVEPPSSVRGTTQLPIAGTSFSYALSDADADTPKEAQYFEMFGHRGIWVDGWKAVTWHRRGTEWSDDEWELYHVDEDFSETNNLAEEEPEKLRELIDRWWIEAGKHGVLPLDDRTITGGPSQRPGNPHDGLRYRYYPPTAHIHGRVSPMLQIGDWTITAEIERSSTDEAGVLFAHGSMAGGVSLYVQDNRLCLDHNSREQVTSGRSTSELPPGRSTLTASLSSQADRSGVVTLLIDGQEAGRIEIADVSGIAVRGGADVGADHYSPVTSSYDAPFEFDGTIHMVDVTVSPTGQLSRPQTPREASESG